MDYQREYDEYWSRADRWGSHSFKDPRRIADEIISLCDRGKLLDVGCGMGLLARTLLERARDADALNLSAPVMEESNKPAPGRFPRAPILGIPFPDDAFDSVAS